MLIHRAAACVVPLMAFRLLLSWQEIRRNLLFIYLAIAASVVPMMLLALMNDEFPAVAGGMMGLLITVWLTRRRIGLVDDQPAGEETPVTSAQSVVKAMFPLWGTVLVLLATRIPQLGLRAIAGCGPMAAGGNTSRLISERSEQWLRCCWCDDRPA